MATTIGSMVVKLIADAKQFEQQMAMSSKTLQGVERNFERTARRLERFGQSMMLGVTTPMALIGGSALNMAMEAEEAHNLFEVTMGSMAAEAESFSKRLTDSFGLSTDAVNAQQAAFFRHFKLYGIGRDQALRMAQSLSMLTNDLGSFVNMDATDVMERLQSGLRGEGDAVEKLGILLADSIVKQTAYRNGLAKQGQELTEQQKQYARYLAIMEQTADAQGDLARTINSPTNQLRIIKQQLSEANKEFGRGLLPFLQAAMPMLRRMTTALNNAALAFQQMTPAMREFVVWSGLALMATGPVAWGLGMLVSGAASVVGGLNSIVRFGKNAFANIAKLRAGTASLGAVMVAIFGSKTKLIVAAILGIAAAAALLVANWKAVAAAAARVWGAISAVVLYAASLIVRGLSMIIGAFSWLVPALRPAADAVRGWADSLKGAAGAALTTAKSASAMATVGSSAQQAASSANQAAKAQENLGDSMEETAKAAGDNLQSFDQVHQVQEKMADSPAAAMPGMEMPGIELPGIGGISDMVEGLGQQLTSMGQSVSQVWTQMGQSISQAWDNLLAKAPLLRSAVDGVNTAFDWVRTNWPTIGPIVEGLASVLAVSMVPALINTGVQAAIAGGQMVGAWITSGMQAAWSAGQQLIHFGSLIGQWIALGFQATVNAAKAVAGWVVQGWQAAASVGAQIGQFLLLIGRWVALGVQATVEAAKVAGAWLLQKTQAVASAVAQVPQFILLVGKWIWMGAQSLLAAGRVALAWMIAMGPIPLVIAAVAGLVALIVIYWNEIVTCTTTTWETVKTWLTDTWNSISVTATEIWDGIKRYFVGLWDAIKGTIVEVWTGIATWFSETWNGISATAAEIWNGIKTWFVQYWDDLLIAFTGPVGLIVGLVVSNWDNIKTWSMDTWNNIAGGLEGIWNGIKDTAGNIWDGIVGAIKAPINRAIGLINSFLDHIASIKIEVPSIDLPFGKSIGGFSIGLPNIPRIPMLADGGDIVGRGHAIVGEAGAELIDLPRGARVTPLSGGGGSSLADDIAQAVYAAVRQAMQGSGRASGPNELIMQIDGQRFARIILPAIVREGERTGSPVVQLQGV